MGKIKNKVITERINLPILDIRIEFSGDRFYSEMELKEYKMRNVFYG
jgi:hypothetical protein